MVLSEGVAAPCALFVLGAPTVTRFFYPLAGSDALPSV